MLNITVLGLGYIGLPTAIAFANSGFKVFGFDINNQILNQLSQNKLHIEEPGLSDHLIRPFKRKTLYLYPKLRLLIYLSLQFQHHQLARNTFQIHHMFLMLQIPLLPN